MKYRREQATYPTEPALASCTAETETWREGGPERESTSKAQLWRGTEARAYKPIVVIVDTLLDALRWPN